VSREAFETVGGLDERFRGWGSEDVAFAESLTTLFSPPQIVRGDCVHLNHARIGKSGRDFWPGQDNYDESAPLMAEYRKARRHPDLMRELIANRGVRV
jgi:hypothetical protein